MFSWRLKCFLGVLFCLLALLISTSAFALDKKNSLALSHYIMAGVYERLGDIDKAIQEYEKSLESGSDNSLTHIKLAASYIKKGNNQKAIGELKIASGLDPEAVEPHAILALLYALEEKADLATSEYELALKNASKLDPKNTDIYRSLGVVYLQQKRFKEAKDVYRVILDLSPEDAEAHFYLANIYDTLNEDQLAEAELKKAIELNPQYPEALNYLGYMYVEQSRNLVQAELMIKKALAIDPDNGAYVDSLGWLYFKKGRTQEALKELEKAATLLDDPEIYSHLGDVYFKMGDVNKAKNSWEKSLSMNPNQEKIKDKIKKISSE